MKRRYSVGLFALAVAVLFLWIGSIQAGEGAQDVIKFDAKKGVVEFKHKVHSDERKITCKTCHHKTEEGQTPKACKSCHDKEVEKEDAPKLKQAMHKCCKACHKKSNLEQGKAAPTKCNGCHAKKEG